MWYIYLSCILRPCNVGCTHYHMLQYQLSLYQLEFWVLQEGVKTFAMVIVYIVFFSEKFNSDAYYQTLSDSDEFVLDDVRKHLMSACWWKRFPPLVLFWSDGSVASVGSGSLVDTQRWALYEAMFYSNLRSGKRSSPYKFSQLQCSSENTQIGRWIFKPDTPTISISWWSRDKIICGCDNGDFVSSNRLN